MRLIGAIPNWPRLVVDSDLTPDAKILAICLWAIREADTFVNIPTDAFPFVRLTGLSEEAVDAAWLELCKTGWVEDADATALVTP